MSRFSIFCRNFFVSQCRKISKVNPSEWVFSNFRLRAGMRHFGRLKILMKIGSLQSISCQTWVSFYSIYSWFIANTAYIQFLKLFKWQKRRKMSLVHWAIDQNDLSAKLDRCSSCLSSRGYSRLVVFNALDHMTKPIGRLNLESFRFNWYV